MPTHAAPEGAERAGAVGLEHREGVLLGAQQDMGGGQRGSVGGVRGFDDPADHLRDARGLGPDAGTGISLGEPGFERGEQVGGVESHALLGDDEAGGFGEEPLEGLVGGRGEIGAHEAPHQPARELALDRIIRRQRFARGKKPLLEGEGGELGPALGGVARTGLEPGPRRGAREGVSTGDRLEGLGLARQGRGAGRRGGGDAQGGEEPIGIGLIGVVEAPAVQTDDAAHAACGLEVGRDGGARAGIGGGGELGRIQHGLVRAHRVGGPIGRFVVTPRRQEVGGPFLGVRGAEPETVDQGAPRRVVEGLHRGSVGGGLDHRAHAPEQPGLGRPGARAERVALDGRQGPVEGRGDPLVAPGPIGELGVGDGGLGVVRRLVDALPQHPLGDGPDEVGMDRLIVHHEELALERQGGAGTIEGRARDGLAVLHAGVEDQRFVRRRNQNLVPQHTHPPPNPHAPPTPADRARSSAPAVSAGARARAARTGEGSRRHDRRRRSLRERIQRDRGDGGGRDGQKLSGGHEEIVGVVELGRGSAREKIARRGVEAEDFLTRRAQGEEPAGSARGRGLDENRDIHLPRHIGPLTPRRGGLPAADPERPTRRGFDRGDEPDAAGEIDHAPMSDGAVVEHGLPPEVERAAAAQGPRPAQRARAQIDRGEVLAVETAPGDVLFDREENQALVDDEGASHGGITQTGGVEVLDPAGPEGPARAGVDGDDPAIGDDIARDAQPREGHGHPVANLDRGELFDDALIGELDRGLDRSLHLDAPARREREPVPRGDGLAVVGEDRIAPDDRRHEEPLGRLGEGRGLVPPPRGRRLLQRERIAQRVAPERPREQLRDVQRRRGNEDGALGLDRRLLGVEKVGLVEPRGLAPTPGVGLGGFAKPGSLLGKAIGAEVGDGEREEPRGVPGALHAPRTVGVSFELEEREAGGLEVGVLDLPLRDAQSGLEAGGCQKIGAFDLRRLTRIEQSLGRGALGGAVAGEQGGVAEQQVMDPCAHAHEQVRVAARSDHPVSLLGQQALEDADGFVEVADAREFRGADDAIDRPG